LSRTNLKDTTIQLLEKFQHNKVSFNGTIIYIVSMLTMVSVKQIYFIRTPPKIYGTKAIYRYVNLRKKNAYFGYPTH